MEERVVFTEELEVLLKNLKRIAEKIPSLPRKKRGEVRKKVFKFYNLIEKIKSGEESKDRLVEITAFVDEFFKDKKDDLLKNFKPVFVPMEKKLIKGVVNPDVVFFKSEFLKIESMVERFSNYIYNNIPEEIRKAFEKEEERRKEEYIREEFELIWKKLTTRR